jgi:ataxia telangiectasia mutated family protein
MAFCGSWYTNHIIQIRDGFSSCAGTIRSILGASLGLLGDKSYSGNMVELDDFESFKAITDEQQRNPTSESRLTLYTTEVAILFLSAVPTLQTASGTASHDKQLVDLFLECRDEKFLAIAPALLIGMNRRLLSLTASGLEQLLERFADLLQEYSYSASEHLQLLLINFLSATSRLWLQDGHIQSEVGGMVRQLCHHLGRQAAIGKITSWRVRERLARFLDDYLAQDPWENFWLTNVNAEVPSPVSILQAMGEDPELRVRMRVAVTNARLFRAAHIRGQDSSEIYDGIRQCFSTDINEYVDSRVGVCIY